MKKYSEEQCQLVLLEKYEEFSKSISDINFYIKEHLNPIFTLYFNILNNIQNIINVCNKINNDNKIDISTVLYDELNEIDVNIITLLYIDITKCVDELQYKKESLKQIQQMYDRYRNIKTKEDIEKYYKETIELYEKNGDLKTAEYFKNDTEEERKKWIESSVEEYKQELREYEDISRLLKEHIDNIIMQLLKNKELIDIYNGIIEENDLLANEFQGENQMILQAFLDYKISVPKNEIVYCYETKKEISELKEITINTVLKSETYGDFYYESLKKIEKLKKDNQILKCHRYFIDNFLDIVNLYTNYIIENKIRVKKCKNCGKYFVPHNKQIYCDNPSPQNKNKTCKLLSHDLRNNKKPIYEVYRNNYKTQSNKKRRNTHIKTIEKKFDKWNKLAREEMEKCIRGEITLDEYKQWHKNNQDWIKKF